MLQLYCGILIQILMISTAYRLDKAFDFYPKGEELNIIESLSLQAQQQYQCKDRYCYLYALNSDRIPQEIYL